ncbi:hypothetical protein AB0I91_17860 [Actinosynnema sp. NPDC049800]
MGRALGRWGRELLRVTGLAELTGLAGLAELTWLTRLTELTWLTRLTELAGLTRVLGPARELALVRVLGLRVLRRLVRVAGHRLVAGGLLRVTGLLPVPRLRVGLLVGLLRVRLVRVGRWGREALRRRRRTPAGLLGWREAVGRLVGWGGHLAFLSTANERNVPSRAAWAQRFQPLSDARTRQNVTEGST